MLTIDCLDHPVILFLKNGRMFKVDSLKSKYHFQTEFFIITHVDKSKNCLTLMLLRPCSSCHDNMVLKPMDECITIDMRCFCGYQSLPNACIRKCNHPAIQINDCICVPFTMIPGHDATVLWQSNITANQYGMINLCIEKGKKEPLNLRLYCNDLCEYKTYPLIGQKLYNFSVTNCSLIKIMRSNTKTTVKGLFEIKSHAVIGA